MSGNIATKYRPNTFADVVGQPTTVEALRRIASANGIVARAIFLKGAYGSGKSTLARIFGKAVNCETFKNTGEVCNTCAGCLEAQSRQSRTYYEFDSSTVGTLDAIRKMSTLFETAPPDGTRRVLCFDEIHAASKQALNALLKVIEDGVPNTIFVFASTEDILATIKSRSVILEVGTIPHELVKQRVCEVAKMENIDLPDSDAELIALRSHGHMRDALASLQLYQIAGPGALASSYNAVRKFIFSAFSKKSYDDAYVLEALDAVVRYPLVDIQNSIQVFIKNLYTVKGGLEEQFLKAGLAHQMFSFFYEPQAVQAMQDEVGIEILLRSLYERARGTGK